MMVSAERRPVVSAFLRGAWRYDSWETTGSFGPGLAESRFREEVYTFLYMGLMVLAWKRGFRGMIVDLDFVNQYSEYLGTVPIFVKCAAFLG
jgi:hypothetical protein